MNVFTDVYEKAIDLLKVKSLEASWSEIESGLKALIAAGGPDDGRAEVLKTLRDKLKEAAQGATKPAEAVADEILKACVTDKTGFQDRAALIKAMKHFYFVRKTGNQMIWVVDSPKSYEKWTFDQFSGKSATTLKTQLQQEEETFGKDNRKMFSDALQLSRKWSQDIEAKLSSPNDGTLKIVKRWFHSTLATKSGTKKSAGILHAGFKKISRACNSTSVIFSDRPHLRTGGTYDTTFASVNKKDVMPVIYIFKLFLESGQKDSEGEIGKLWLCALTIIHELSHKLVGTADIKYDDDGLKPGVFSFSNKKAINNADSWGYFAADMVGALPQAKFEEVYK